MAGRFEGLSDLEWHLFADIFPPEAIPRGRGMPHTPFRQVVNMLLYVLITGCRWGARPRGPQWASKSAAHRWLQRWQVDGTLAARQAWILGACRGARDDAVAVWGRRRRLFPLAQAAVTALPTGGKARGFCSVVSPRPGACC